MTASVRAAVSLVLWAIVRTLYPEVLANPLQVKTGFDLKSLFLYRHPTKICGQRSDLIKRFNFLI